MVIINYRCQHLNLSFSFKLAAKLVTIFDVIGGGGHLSLDGRFISLINTIRK